MKLFTLFLVSIISAGITFGIITAIFFTPTDITKLRIGERIEFQTKDGAFTFSTIPSKGRDHETMERKFKTFKEKENLPDNVILYRTTRKNYLKISKWCQYKYMPEWNYPLLK